MWNIGVPFDVSLNKLLNKQFMGRWFDMHWSLFDVAVMINDKICQWIQVMKYIWIRDLQWTFPGYTKKDINIGNNYVFFNLDSIASLNYMIRKNVKPPDGRHDVGISGTPWSAKREAWRLGPVLLCVFIARYRVKKTNPIITKKKHRYATPPPLANIIYFVTATIMTLFGTHREYSKF